jgi:hypothetical protein
MKGITGSNPEMDSPTVVTISSKKVIQENRTVGGYTFSHWGDGPDKMTARGSVILVPGREGLGFLSLLILKQLYRLDKKKIKNIMTGVLKYAPTIAAFTASAYGELASQKIALSGINASTISLAAQTATIGAGLVLATQNIQQQTKLNPDLGVTYIYHDNYIYRGFFNSFEYTRDANNPRFINYSFTFTIDWSTENYFADILLKSSEGQTVTAFA